MNKIFNVSNVLVYQLGKINETAYLQTSGKSIPNLKSTRTPEQIEHLSFGAFGAKIPL